jgi:phospholipid/cholesterol/gamma-HCH transport system substrate-binding protein
MAQEQTRNIWLGLFVTTGVVLFIVALYMIGSNQSIFGKTTRVVVLFNNVSGLQEGNNVRFAGTDVGTVSNIEIISENAVRVILKIDDKYAAYVKKNAIASIGTDGLMGNKLVNILNAMGGENKPIVDNDTILSLDPVETDEMLRTLNRTNEYVSSIALNLKNITDQIGNSRGTLWKLLTDKEMAMQLDTIISNFQTVSAQARVLSNNLNQMSNKVQTGQGLLGTLLTDTTFAVSLQRTMTDLRKSTERTSAITKDLQDVIHKIDKGNGAFWTMVQDTAVRDDLIKSISNIKNGTDNFNQSMEALKANPFLKKYFKEQEEKQKKKK